MSVVCAPGDMQKIEATKVTRKSTLFALLKAVKLTTTKEADMSTLLIDKRDSLAQRMGWTQQRAQGYVDGETSQLNGQELPDCHRAEMNEYSKGFRTGYYTRACSLSISNIRETLTAR